MRVLPFVLAVGLAAAGCGLDPNGLGSGDDSGSPSESGPPPPDGTLVEDASGTSDATLLPDTGTSGDASGDDVALRRDAGGDAGTEAGVDGGGDAGSDTGTDGAADAGPRDAGADAADACGAVEICNNGIDDNCDGKIDCADPQCAPAWTCTAASVPTGWTIVEYVSDQRPACSPGYGSPTDVVEGPSGAAATCGCSCSVTTPGSCESGNFTVSVNGLFGCTSPTVTSPAAGGACSPAVVNYPPPAGAKMQVNAAPYTAGTCAPDASVSVPPLTYAGQGRVCANADGAGEGCPNGGTCAPTATGGGFHLCVARDGIQPCPAGFTQPHTISNGVTDTRGCTKCSCSGPTATCVNASFSFFPVSDCDDAGVTLAADGKCNAFPGPTGPGAPTYIAYEYTAQVQGEGCTASPVSPDGGIALVQARTVCCQ